MADVPSQTTGLTRASIAVGTVALVAWAWTFLSTAGPDWVIVIATTASIVTIALGLLARSEAAAGTGEKAPLPRWMTAVGIALGLLTTLAIALFAVLSGMGGPH